jgi:cysteine desulfurase / selenocysteine lyase
MAGLSTVEIENIRKDFPILASKVHGKPLVYLDNAASAQKPRQVIESLNYFYANDYSNVHRGVHALSERATNLFEAARDKVKKFISAAFREEIIWVRGTTEAINLVAQSFVRPRLLPDDEIIITHLEHHANIVPWQMVCEQTGAKLKVVPITDEGEIIFDEFIKLINPKTKFISISHISNALGTINPVEKMIQTARDHHIPVMLDGAQAVVHQKIDVQVLDCDFYAFSSHKLYAHSGIGVLYGRK